MANLRAGTQFNDRYTIVRRIGSGGMGEVYLAQEVTNPEFYVALKVIPPGVIETPTARERFRNEIVAAYRINHPNIVKAYEYFDGNNLQAYAMEYVSGGNLLTRIKREPIPADSAVRYLRQIAAALEAIHEAGIIHRDLKPENILLTADDQVKLADFGVARVSGSQTLTQAGGMVGTPKYIPPEYLETGESDHRGDIFALGVLGYEMISGVSPFPDDSRELLAARKKNSHPPPLVKVAPHCPPQLAQIIERAMNPNLAQRYQSAADVGRELERFEGMGPNTVADKRREYSDWSTVPLKRPRNHSPLTPRRFSLSHIAGGGAVVGAFAALIIVIAVPTFISGLPPPRAPERFDFAVVPGGRAPSESLDPRELGLELVRLAELETTYTQLRDDYGNTAPSGDDSATAPRIDTAPGTISSAQVRERTRWLEREIALLQLQKNATGREGGF